MLAVALLAASVPLRAQPRDEAQSIKTWLQSYDAAFNAKDLERLAGFYHPDVTIYEGGSVNNGWLDYRDNHLGPELNEFLEVQLSHAGVTPHLMDAAGRAAYVTSEYRLKVRMKERDIDTGGLETLVLVKTDDGSWKIRHSHTSSRRRPAAPPPGARP
ncbi:MAG: nuclear transport factor 2 family protein [Vicinamibacteria bacterium]